ncbi:hypothetical protein MMPV_009013 [Pyropia vietnamensis]
MGDLSVGRAPEAPAPTSAPPPPLAGGSVVSAASTVAAAAAAATTSSMTPEALHVDDPTGSEPELDAHIGRQPASPRAPRRQFSHDAPTVETDEDGAGSDDDDVDPYGMSGNAVGAGGRRASVASAASAGSDWGDVADGVATEDTSVASTTPRLSTVSLSDGTGGPASGSAAAVESALPMRATPRQPPPPSRPRLVRVASDGPGSANFSDAPAAHGVRSGAAAPPTGGATPRMMPSASFTAGSSAHRSPGVPSGATTNNDAMCTQCSGLERRIASLVDALKTAPPAAGDADGDATGGAGGAGTSSSSLTKTGSGWGLRSMSSLVSKGSKSSGERARLRQEVDVLRATVSFLYQRLQDAEEEGVGTARAAPRLS